MPTSQGPTLIKQVLLLIYFAYTLVRPIAIRTPCSFLEDIVSLPLHARFTLIAFLSACLMVFIDTTPIAQSLWHLRTNGQRVPLTWIAKAKMVSGMATWLATGSMRRGPRLRYDEIKLGTGFGIPGNKDEKVEDGGEECNVIDWYGSPVLGILTMWQVSNAPVPAPYVLSQT